MRGHSRLSLLSSKATGRWSPYLDQIVRGRALCLLVLPAALMKRCGCPNGTGRHDMPAYIIAHGEITDREVFREYGRRSHPLLEKFGGKVVAGGKHEVLEGDWHPKVLVVTQWPDMAAARPPE